jgi:hypothetical protein
MAQLLQEPQVKIGTAVFLRGEKGTGKSIVGVCLGKLIGAAHTVPVNSPRMLTGTFNAHFETALLILVEEGFWAGDKDAEGRLKDVTTNETQMIERKGIDAIKTDSFVRLFGTSNADWVVPATADERRWFVLDVGDGRRKDTEYFEALLQQMEEGGYEAMLYDLLRFDYGDLDLRNPPRTSALTAQIEEGFDHPERWWHGVLRDGVFRDNRGQPLEEAIWELDSPLRIEKSCVFCSYDAGVRGPGGRPAAMSRWGKFMKKYAQGMSVSRGPGHERPYLCTLPPRRDLQGHFTAMTGVGFEEDLDNQQPMSTFDDVMAKEVDRMVAMSLFDEAEEWWDDPDAFVERG